ncbi:MAG: hypothetical protein FWC58_00885 [Desulfobulbus sp.]|nr:hypothetical protein [Desulfobulbus sp.]
MRTDAKPSHGKTPADARQTGAASSSFRSVRVQGDRLIRHLRSRHVLWLHGWIMGLLTLGTMWAGAAALRHAGIHSLAVRYGLVLGAGYLCYLLLLRIWAGALVRQRELLEGVSDLPDIINTGSNGGSCHAAASNCDGISGHIDLPAEAGDGAGSALGGLASGALEGAGAADEGAIVIIPVLAVFAMITAAVLGAGWLLLAYFGTDALLAAAVELAFAYTAARTAVRVEREGWLLAAIRLTWKPLLGALVSAVLLGALIDHFIPQVDTLPAAVRTLRGR